jgi:hypothetical protein
MKITLNKYQDQTVTKCGRPDSHADYQANRGPLRKVDVAAKARRRNKMFRNRKLKGNPVLESR